MCASHVVENFIMSVIELVTSLTCCIVNSLRLTKNRLKKQIKSFLEKINIFPGYISYSFGRKLKSLGPLKICGLSTDRIH